jgi:RNA polymerase sigma-70 factor (ECF subfamily)
MERQIYAVAYSVLRDFSLSDDAVQDTYLKIVDKAHTYTKGSNAKAWILTVARNIALDILKHRRFEVQTDRIAEIRVRFDESAFVTSLAIKEALDNLDDEERQIVTLKIYSGFKHKDIADLLGITAESAKKKYQRALIKLKEFL